MASEAQLLFDLFDFHWFSHQIFNKSQNPPSKSPKNEDSAAETSQNLEFSSVPMINVRYYSDPHDFISESPNSVLDRQTPKTENSFSGMEAKEIAVPVKDKNSGRKRNIKSKSKSLSELEFEELKGFMDLGFLFSEKDKDSSLVSMIPGLQRLGKDEEEQVHDYVNVSRPYLSEAWGDLEKKREEVPRMIRFPALRDESEIKNQLRFWAHSVASVVR